MKNMKTIMEGVEFKGGSEPIAVITVNDSKTTFEGEDAQFFADFVKALNHKKVAINPMYMVQMLGHFKGNRRYVATREAAIDRTVDNLIKELKATPDRGFGKLLPSKG